MKTDILTQNSAFLHETFAPTRVTAAIFLGLFASYPSKLIFAVNIVVSD